MIVVEGAPLTRPVPLHTQNRDPPAGMATVTLHTAPPPSAPRTEAYARTASEV